MRAGRASTSTPASACRPGIGTASSASVATRCDPRWPTSACTARPAGTSPSQLRTPWGDGTTHVAFSPSAFLARLAVLIPRPRVNLLLYHGVLAPRASWRTEVVPHAPASAASGVPDESPSARLGVQPEPGLALGRPDATGVRARRPGVSPLRRAPAAHRGARGVGHHGPHPPPSPSADRGPPARAGPSAARRGRLGRLTSWGSLRPAARPGGPADVCTSARPGERRGAAPPWDRRARPC